MSRDPLDGGEEIVQGSDALTVIAELGVALAGFSGIVVALRQRSVESWSHSEVLRLRFMLYASVSIFLFAVLPFVPHHLGASPTLTWSMSSLLLAASLTFAVLYNVIQARPPRTDLSFRWWVIYSAGGSLAIVALLANVGGLLGRPGVGGYLVGVVVLLIYATTLFVRLVLAPFSRRGTSAED